MPIDSAQPYSLRTYKGIEQRRLMLTLTHIAPLAQYVDRIAAEVRSDYRIPYFDRCGSGINARVLFLLEPPEAKTVVRFIFRNNPDPSARKMCTSSRVDPASCPLRVTFCLSSSFFPA
jgi:hypothetical protein